AGFRASAGESFAAEWLHADDGAGHAAIDVAIADVSERLHLAPGRLDARMHAEREPVARPVDLVDHRFERLRRIADHVQHRAEVLAVQLLDRLDLHRAGREERAVPRGFRNRKMFDRMAELLD